MAEHGLGPPGPQGIGVVDAVAARQQGVDDGHGLVPDVGPSGRSPQVHGQVEQSLQLEVLGQGRRKQEPGIGHKMIVIETDVEPVQGVR